ncbi:T9SS type A sorting domain-containing protein [Parapedobacter sp. SGR-10]|nr:T9SS type A sorting domain-containing protein [Parapedobacter sp. SGR-10]
MKVFVLYRTKLIMVNIIMFAVLSLAMPVFGHDYARTNMSMESSVGGYMGKDDDAEKNITNVKVMYNPVAEQINVNFKLSKESTVVIKLMDALGNEVLNLSNSNLDAGAQSLSFDTESKVSAGFYFIKLTSGTETVIKRLSIR